LTLALRLGKTIREIEGMSLDEFNEWLAYFRLTAKDEKRGAKG
jgi:hypothetical protein